MMKFTLYQFLFSPTKLRVNYSFFNIITITIIKLGTPIRRSGSLPAGKHGQRIIGQCELQLSAPTAVLSEAAPS